MTVAELEQRMSNREFIEQMIYDKLVLEAEQEAAMDRQLSADHAALLQRMKAR